MTGVLAWVRGAVAGVVVQTPGVPPADPAAGRGEEFGKTSPLALVVILLLALATILLIRSMNKRLRNVPASFETPEPEPRTDAPTTDSEGTDGAGPDGAGSDGPDAPGRRPDPPDDSVHSTSSTS